jgi:hypothetical protein
MADPGGAIDRQRCQACEVRNTISANRAVAVTTISEPTIGKTIKRGPSSTTMATPTGNRMPPTICSQP